MNDLIFNLQRFAATVEDGKVTIPAGDTYALDGVTYTAIEDSQLNLDDDGKISGIASGKVQATVTRRKNPIVTFDASDGAVNFTATSDGSGITVTKLFAIELISGEFTYKGNKLNIGVGATLAIVNQRGNYTLRNENTFEFGGNYIFSNTDLTTESQHTFGTFTLSDGVEVRQLHPEQFGKVINRFTERGFTLTKGSSEALHIGGYTVTATAVDDAALNIDLNANGLTLVPAHGDGTLNVALTRGDTTILEGELECTSGNITVGFDNSVTFAKDTSFNLTQGDYVLTATTTDTATIGISLQGNNLVFTPGQNDGGLNLLLTRGGTPIFGGELNVTNGSITFNPNTQKFSFTEGTEVSIAIGGDNPQEFGFKVTGGDASIKVESDGAGNFTITPDKGDGSLDITLKSADSSLNANIEVLSGSFILSEGGKITVTKGTELQIDFGGGYIVNLKAQGDAGGSISLGADGITFAPNSSDGGLQLSITRDGQTRTASLDVTGSVTYKLDGSISLAKGTVVRNVFDSGNVLTITANTDASGSMIFTPQRGLDITSSTPDALNVVLTTGGVDVVNISSIIGSINYTGGVVTVSDGTKISMTDYEGYDSILTVDGGTASVKFGSDRAVYTANVGATLNFDWLDGKTWQAHNSTTLTDTYNGYAILSEGATFNTNDTLILTILEKAGNYTLNGMNITTTKDNVEVVLHDYDTVAFAADAPVKISTAEGGKLFMVAESDGTIQATTKATNNVEVTNGAITFDPATKKFSATKGTTVSFTRGEQIINFTADKDISATYKIEEDVHYFMLDGGATANLSISSGGQTIFAGDLEMGGVLSYRPSTGTFGLTGANSSHGDGTNTFVNLTLIGRDSGSTYDIRAATHDTTVVFVPDLVDGKLEINFPNARKHALNFTFSKDGQTLVNNDIAIDGKIGLDFATREVYMTKGTTVDLKAGDFSAVFTANDDASVKLSVDNGIIKITPKDGDGSLDFAIKRGDTITFASNLSISGGSIVLEPATQSIGLTKGTTLTLTQGNNVMTITALDDASGQLSFVDGGIRFAPNAGDGALELNFVSVGRKATLNVTGAIVFGNEGKISLEDGTVADLTWTDGVNLKMTSHGSEGSITLDADKGIKITSDDENLDIALTTPAGVQTNISGIKGTLYYNAGTISFDDNSTITATTTLGGQPIFTTLETIGGTGHISFADNGTVYAADTGAMRITWSRDGKESTFTVNSGTIQIGHGLFKIAEGTDLSTDLKDFVPALYFTTSEAGSYTLNGQKITTTTANIPITATDDMMTFKLSGGEISVDDMTFTGRGNVIITADGVTVGAGVEVAGLAGSKSFILTEAGNVTVDNRIFELTEDVPTGISVTGTNHGFEFARTLTKESEERLGYYNSPDIGKIFRESFTARGDDGYRVQTDLLGLQQIIGITAPVTVKAGAALDDEPIETLFDIVTDSAGVVKIDNKPYTISGDSSVVVKVDFEPDKSYVRGFNDLSGTVSGDFTPHAVSLDGGDPIIIHGDRAIDIVNSANGAEIFNLSNRATLESLGGVSKVHTDTAGKFQFGNTAVDSLGVTIRGDENVTFDFDSDQELTGVSNLEGDLTFNCMSDKLLVNGTGVTIDGEISSIGAYDGLLYLHDATDGTAINTSAVDKTWAQMRGASMALNANNLTLTEDDDGIWIRNKEVFGLDEGASLQVSEAGSYVINGEELTASANDIIVGLGEAGAYVYDANDPLITRKSSAADIIDWFKPENVTVVSAEDGGTHNISMSGGDLAVVEKTAARVNISSGDDTVVSQGKNVHVSLTGGNTWLFATGGKMTLEGYDAATGTGFGTNYLDIAAAVDGGAINFSDGELSIGSAVVDLGKRNEIVDFYDRSGALQAVGFASHNGELDASNATQNLIIVGDTFSTLRGGAGNDTIFAAEGSNVDGGAGNNVIKLPETRNGYTGATIDIANGRNTIENFSAGFEHSSDVVVNDEGHWHDSFDGTNISIKTAASMTVLENVGTGEAFIKLKSSEGGVEYKVAVAQKNSVIAAGDELADIYSGENSGVDFTGFKSPLFVDLRNNGLPHFYGINRVTAGKGSTTLIGSAGNETLTAGTARNSIWGGAGNDLLNGNTSDDKGGSTEFFFVAGDSKDTIRNFEFYDGSNLMTADKINVGTDEVTSVNVNGAGNVLLQINGGDDWLTLDDAQGKLFQINNLTAKVDTTALAYDDKANCFVATGLDATLTVDESAEIWLDGTHGKYYLGEIKTLDASNSTGENILAGNALDNTIIAGSGKTSLWGGDLGNDMLIGGAGKDMFFYALGNGNDTISGATDGDVINLAGVTLEQIISTEIAQGSVTINFADGGRLNVASSAAVEFALGGEIYLADQTSNTWHKK